MSLSAQAVDHRTAIIRALRAAQPLSPYSLDANQSTRLFEAQCAAADWNRAHADHPILPIDVNPPLPNATIASFQA